MDSDDEQPIVINHRAAFPPPLSYEIQRPNDEEDADPWEERVGQEEEPVLEPTFVDPPPLPKFSIRAWLRPTHPDRSGFGYYRSYIFIPYSCNPRIHYPMHGPLPLARHVQTRTIAPYYPFNTDLDPSHNIMNLWISFKNPEIIDRLGIERSRFSLFKNFVHPTGDSFANELYAIDFLGKFNTRKMEIKVTSTNFATSGRGTAQVSSTSTASNSIEELRSLLKDDTLYFEQTYNYSPSSLECLQAKELLFDFSQLSPFILLSRTAHKNFIWACEILTSTPKTHPVVHAQLRIFISILPTLIKWMESFDSRKSNFEINKEQYERSRDKARFLLSDYDKFLTSYVDNAYSYSEDDEDHPILTEDEIAKNLKKYSKKAKKALTSLKENSATSLSLKIEEVQLQEEETFFQFAWDTFHNFVTFVYPHEFVASAYPEQL